ncbi:MsnO8 family LLM class oxidoreductase [Paenibacillus sp. AR247]|uniref:MsnO8 family LLM class oxidoreductase n=1 Tax=Paenibacillus sp. AR247 TaxID=1631599 RepID=UPI00215734AF|nr:MsnO8 family LLM class oxidoreductase [Paenibacillus sp. AR247]
MGAHGDRLYCGHRRGAFEEALQEAASLARHAEQWGYTRVLGGGAPRPGEPVLRCAGSAVGAYRSPDRADPHRVGAVLLPHYSPLKVAENFRMLAALYPGRVDLGIGRAPGGSAHASMALSGNYLQHVAEMPARVRGVIELLEDRYAYEDVPVAAKPVPRIQPELWMLGTNNKSAGFAAENGTGYVFGQFMSDRDGAEVLAAYREGFKPSALLEQPRSIAAIGVICAATEQEALALSRRSALPEVERPGAEASEPQPQATRLITGSPKQVKSKLLELADSFGCDEFLVTTPVMSYAERLESYRLLASVCL